MIKSMTGFGKINKSYEKFDVFIEMKSVNSKYFEINFRLPKIVSALEITLRQPLQDIMLRGKVEVRIEITMHTAVKTPVLNQDLLLEYKRIFSEISTITGIEDKPKLDNFLRMPEVLDYSNDESIDEEINNAVYNAVIECAQVLTNMREIEGNKLLTDIKTRINNLYDHVITVEKSKEDIFNLWKEKFIKRMQSFGVSHEYEERIVQEASIMSEKADITEEITRLKSHIDQFNNILDNEYPAGKKLDFLSQEIHRELNTIASKSSKKEIISTVVEAKAEADRIREQVQNII